MKKLLILILIFALSSTLLLSACAPDKPVTDDDLLYGKPRLSKMSDDEILKMMSKLKLMGEYDEEDILRIKQYIAAIEDNINHLCAYSNTFSYDMDILFVYYYDNCDKSFDISQYIK